MCYHHLIYAKRLKNHLAEKAGTSVERLAEIMTGAIASTIC